MQVLIPGHSYKVDDQEGGQFIDFVRKELIGDQLLVTMNGTTTEEVLSVLIDRMKTLNEILPSDHNAIAISHLEFALSTLLARTADRMTRNVEGTNQP